MDRITSANVLGCLARIWTSKPGAARKARHRISAVFRWCIGKILRPDNPVDRAAVALPRANGNAPTHYRALPHREVAAALGAIRRVRYIHPSAVLCVEMVALTAVRAGEARGALWDEIDLKARRWTIPASRMKAGREFCVPLSTGALDVIERARTLSPESSLVFPSKTGGLLARNAPGRVLRRAAVASRVHGFRSSARSWMAESRVPAEVAEACLAHVPRKQGGSGVSAVRPAGAPRGGPPGVVRLRHAAIGRRLRKGLRGRFRAANAHFGVDTGCRIAPDRRSPVSEGTGRGKKRCSAASAPSPKSDGPPVAVAVFEADGQEAGELARDGRVAAVPGGAQGGFSRASEGLALDPLLVLSQPTRCSTFAVWQGGAEPP